MRNRGQIDQDMLIAARPSESDKYLLRLLKAELLTVELLLDVRELLQRLQPPTIINQPPCDCATTKMDGESEHWPSCRYA